jgi:RNA polymerase sigma-70 factor (ECF subfamily)
MARNPDMNPKLNPEKASVPASSGRDMQVWNTYTDSQGNKEARLFQRMAQGDHSALDELYAMYANPLFSYAYKMLGDQEESEEVLQDTFVRLWKKAGKFQPDISKPFTWSVMILRGLCIDRLRKRGTRARASLVGISFTVVEDHVAQGNRGIERLYFSELTRKVRKALQQLNEDERHCLELVIFGEATHPEISDQLGQPLGTVKSRIRRGLIKLRELLKDIHE